MNKSALKLEQQLYSQPMGFRRDGNDRVKGVYMKYMTDDEAVSSKAEDSLAKSIQRYYLQQLGIDCWVKRVPKMAQTPCQLMIVGEAPRNEDDATGRSFSGPAGELLNRMLAVIDLSQDDVYLFNGLKCNSPEVQACENFLVEEIRLLAPACILVLGETAAQYLLGQTSALQALRLSVHEYAGKPVIVSHSPDFLCQNPLYKKEAYQDLLFLQTVLQS